MTYQLQMIHEGRIVVNTTVAWGPYNSHPQVGEIDGKWRIVELLENETLEVYNVRAEPA
jgi:hypothetical protein